MLDRNEEGLYGRTEAFNFIKDLLGIPHSARINKQFLLVFFRESHEGFCIKRPKEEVEEIFIENNIAKLNKQYFDAKENKDDSMRDISREIFTRSRNGMSAERSTSRSDSPYFVRQPGAR